MTLLQLVQQACREMAQPIPNAVATATDEQSSQLYGIATALGQELAELDHDWQRLITAHTFTTTGTGTASLPSDFLRPINGTWWDTSQNWKVREAMLPQGWRWLTESSLANASPIASLRIAGNAINYYPTTNTGNVFAFDYITKNWAIDGDDSSGKSAFSKDTDTCVFRDRLMINGIKLKFFEIKGFDTLIQERDFGRSLESAMAEQGAPSLHIGEKPLGVRLLDYNNIPDSGYGP